MTEPREPLFVWTETYSVQIQAIDDQHRRLVAYMNDWYEHANRGEIEHACDALEALARFAAIHFQSEEHLLERHGYDGLEPHREAHGKLLEVFDKLSDRFAANPEPKRIERLSKFLKTWLASHILDMDKRYAPYLNGKGVS